MAAVSSPTPSISDSPAHRIPSTVVHEILVESNPGSQKSSPSTHLVSDEEKGDDNGGDYTEDGTVDLRGNPILRSKRGGWRACYFVIVYEVFERMAYYGISSNLIQYLTKMLHQGTVTSANIVTYWVGTSWMTPILGAYVADALLGRYWTFLMGSAIYLLGLILLTAAVSLPGLKPHQCMDPNTIDCKKVSTLQLGVFYGALYTLAIGTGGTKPNISTIGADQFDVFDPKEKSQKQSFFNWWTFSIFLGTFFANTVLVFMQEQVGWSVGYGISTAGLAILIVIFLVGTPRYRHRLPADSAFARMARVIVATLRKWRVAVPSDPREFYELNPEEYSKKGQSMIHSTPILRFLNRACVKTSSTSPRMLCSVTQVEKTKQILRMLPILVLTFVPSMTIAQINTMFVEQGATLRRNLGKFEIPPASLGAITTLSILVSLVLYDRHFVKMARRWTKNPRGISLLQRMGVGMVLHTIVMLIASLTERYRLSMAKNYGVVESGKQVPVTIFVLLPQFVLMGVADAFSEVAKIEFFYDQASESMKSLGTSYSTTSMGVGNFLSSFLLLIISHVTHRGWIKENLNASHLDYFYIVLVVLNFINFIVFLVMARLYVYRAEVSTR